MKGLHKNSLRKGDNPHQWMIDDARMELIQQIKAEVNRQARSIDTATGDFAEGRKMEQRIILSVLSDLEKEEKPTLKEQPVCEELGKELENYARLHPFEDSGSYRNMIQLAHHFAKWGAEHAKEELMKEAVEVVGVAIWQYLDNLGRDFYKIETEEFTTHGEISEGDKVRIIIVKED